jgi:hypothetical protein
MTISDIQVGPVVQNRKINCCRLSYSAEVEIAAKIALEETQYAKTQPNTQGMATAKIFPASVYLKLAGSCISILVYAVCVFM